MLRFAALLDIPGPIVSCNGAFVTGPAGTKILDRALSRPIVDGVLDYAEKHSLHCHAYCGPSVYFSSEGEKADLYRSRTQLDNAEIASLYAMRQMSPNKLLFIDEPHANERHDTNLRDLAEEEGMTIVRSEPDYIEFLPAGITKGAGLATLCQEIGLEPHETAAVGDWLNDLEMLQWVGISAAVSNAHPEIQQTARFTVASNDEDGVAEFIDVILS